MIFLQFCLFFDEKFLYLQPFRDKNSKNPSFWDESVNTILGDFYKLFFRKFLKSLPSRRRVHCDIVNDR